MRSYCSAPRLRLAWSALVGGPVVGAVAAAIAPAVASACPGACGACSPSPFSGALSALGIGILVGIGSVSLQDAWRRRRGR